MHNALTLLNIPIIIAIVMAQLLHYKSMTYMQLLNSGREISSVSPNTAHFIRKLLIEIGSLSQNRKIIFH